MENDKLSFLSRIDARALASKVRGITERMGVNPDAQFAKTHFLMSHGLRYEEALLFLGEMMNEPDRKGEFHRLPRKDN